MSARLPSSLPIGWTTPPVYARFSVQLGKMLDEKRIAGTHLASYLRNVDVQWDHINTADLPEMDFSAEDRERFSLREGDLLVCEGGEVGRTAIWDGRLAECYFQKAIHRLRPITAHDEPRFFRYFMRTAVESGLFALATASTIQHLPAEKLRIVRYPAPPRLQQRAIADYLDRETARLDALVAAKQRVLELLAEKRRALITRAVTRGLDPRAPLRDSGIPWLGEIPGHWETPPVYSRFEVQLGKMLDEKKIKGAHLAPYLRNVDVQWGAINTSDLPQMDFDDEDRRRYALRLGDILVCEGGEVGRCAQWNDEHPECYYQKALHRLRPIGGKDDPAFFVLVMQAVVDSGQFALQSSAATIQHLPAEKLRVVRYPAPPRDEQLAVVAYITEETAKLDALRVATDRTIALLKERRAALIAAAVTGQIDVSHASSGDSACSAIGIDLQPAAPSERYS